jgi:hypothetical protein
MAKVDDLIKRWAKQIVLTIVARLAHGFPPTANLLSKGITKTKSGLPKRKKIEACPRLSCKIEYLPTSNHRDQSTTSEYFTDDYTNSGHEAAPQ